jgi:tRNA(Ile)-lysidine synthase
LERKGFDLLHQALQRSLLRRGVREVAGTLKDIEACHTEDILNHLGRGAGTHLELKGGVVFTIEHGRYILAKKGKTLCPYPPISGKAELKIPGETMLGAWKISVSKVRGNRIGNDEDPFICYLDCEKVGNGLMMRARKPGDRFVPLGMNSAKKLKDFLIDAKIPRSWRERIPVIMCGEKVAWLAGQRISEEFKVTADTRNMLRIEITCCDGSQDSHCPDFKDIR